VTLERLSANGKRDARSYIESLEGIVPFVAARTLLLCYGVHGVPVDEQLRTCLAEAGAVEAEANLLEIAAALGRHIKADAAEATHASLLALVESQGATTKRSSAKAPASGTP